MSVGIKIKEGYVTSGFALNCIPSPQAFLGMDPCGIQGALPDFIFRESIPKEKWNEEFERIPKKVGATFWYRLALS